MRSERTFMVLYAEDIARAIEMRAVGASDWLIWVETGVRAADIYLAEQMGIDAYPMRPASH